MTQALGGMKEWYATKKLKKHGITNIVSMDEEIYVLAKDEAPPIIEEQLQDAGPVPFYICCLQEFMNGGSLEDMQEKGTLTWAIMFKALEEVSATLAGMHENQVQHKDIKPENVMLEKEGEKIVAVKLCDFGSAELGGDKEACANDIRRFGVMMYSLASGQLWTKNRLIRESHDVLIERMSALVANSENATLRQLPDILRTLLACSMDMKTVAKMMVGLHNEYSAG